MTDQTRDELFDTVQSLLGAKEYLKVRELVTEALLLDPFNPLLWNYRSNAHLKLGYPELAFTDAARGLQLLDDQLAKTDLSAEDRNLSIFQKIDVLYSCILAAEDLNVFQTGLHFVDRLLTNSHLLSDEARDTILNKQVVFKRKINDRIKNFAVGNDFTRKYANYATNLGTMRAVKYPWDQYEPFSSEEDTDTQLKQINIMFQKFAPKLMIVRTPDNAALFHSDNGSPATSSGMGRPQLGVVAREQIRLKERILEESGIFINNGLYGPKCNFCNGVLALSTDKQGEVDRKTCKKCGERFCSIRCYELALETYHQAICGRDISPIMDFVAKGSSCSSLSHLFVLRLLAMAIQSNEHPLEMPFVKYLTNGMQEASWDAYYSFTMYLDMLKILGICPYRDIGKFDFWIYYTLRNKLSCNVFGEYKAPQKPENGKLFLFSSFFNHSCVPNAFYITDRHARQVIVTSKDLEKDQQIFISYVDPDRAVVERQQLFNTTFGFDCRCERCIREMELSNKKEMRKKTRRSSRN